MATFSDTHLIWLILFSYSTKCKMWNRVRVYVCMSLALHTSSSTLFHYISLYEILRSHPAPLACLALRHYVLILILSLIYLHTYWIHSPCTCIPHVNLNVKLDNVICALVDFLKASHIRVKFLISLMLILQHNKREILLCPSFHDSQTKMLAKIYGHFFLKTLYTSIIYQHIIYYLP